MGTVDENKFCYREGGRSTQNPPSLSISAPPPAVLIKIVLIKMKVYKNKIASPLPYIWNIHYGKTKPFKYQLSILT